MKVEIPEDYEPMEVPALKKEGENPEVQQWVYLPDGTAKKYKEATGEETFNWAKTLCGEFPIKDSSQLELMAAKNLILDFCITTMITQNRDLFGGPKFWESLPEWQRMSNLKKKGKEEETNEKN